MLRLQTRLSERYTTATGDQLDDMIGRAKAALGSRLMYSLAAHRQHGCGLRLSARARRPRLLWAEKNVTKGA